MVINERPFQCENCDLAFTSKQFLKRHYVVHSNQRNYECTLCSKSYKYKKGLNRHYKKYHPAYYFTNIKGILQGASSLAQIQEEMVNLPSKHQISHKSSKVTPRKNVKVESSMIQSLDDEFLSILVKNEAKIFKTTPFPT